jgi:UDP-N-acetylglucosamine 2-epimerase (non-hydrolysing)
MNPPPLTSSKLLLVVGTRPNFMKAASIMAAVDRRNAKSTTKHKIQRVLVHTGQHYDDKMSEVFFRDLGLPRPDHYLGVGSGTHAEQTAKVMLTLEPVLLEEKPDVVMVVGDVNSTLAATLVASKLKIPVAHVEAGLRSRDRSMPEELNRLATDQLSDILLTSSRDADANLIVEGIPQERIFFVGNTMIDTLDAHVTKTRNNPIIKNLGLTPGQYTVATLHRPSNVDDPDDLARIARVLTWISDKTPVVFPVHARTRANLEQVLAAMPRSERRRRETAVQSGDTRDGRSAARDGGNGDGHGVGNGDGRSAHAAGRGGRAGAHMQVRTVGYGDVDGDRRRPGTAAMRAANRLMLIDPLGYLDFLALTAHARLVITDSGGVQEETSVLGVPCLTLRNSTERPVTIWEGTNRLVDPYDEVAIMAAVQATLMTPAGRMRRPERWDGLAGERIVEITAEWLQELRQGQGLRLQKVAV